MSHCPVVITPKLIRRHNLRCYGRIVLWALGAAAVFLIVFLFLWLLASMVTGDRSLNWPVAVGASVFAVAVFGAGHWYLKRHGPQDWERIAQKPEQGSWTRLSRLNGQGYGQAGQGLFGLILAGPSWLGRIGDDYRSILPATQENATELEQLRLHLGARDDWSPMKDFPSHQEGIHRLAKLNMIAIRELLGEWHFHLTVEGTVSRVDAVNEIEG